MSQQRSSIRSFLVFFCQTFLHEIGGSPAQTAITRLIEQNVVVSLALVFAAEGHFIVKHLVCEDAQSPNIHSTVVVLIGFFEGVVQGGWIIT